jgi:MFS superfamily sulfate permease-like transporter
VFLGTSKHLSTGTYAILSLIIASSVRKYSGILYPLPGTISGHDAHFTDHTTANYSDYDYYTTTVGIDHVHGHSDGHGAAAVAGDPAFYITHDPVQGAVMLAMTLSFLAGIIQLGLGMLHVGFVTKYLSDTIVNGFTCGAAFHVIVSQIATLLGIKLNGIHIPFVLIGVWWSL